MSASLERLQRLEPRERLADAARRLAPPRLGTRDVADLGIALGIVLLGAALTLGPANPLRLIVGSLAVLVAPGYLLLEAALPSPGALAKKRWVRLCLAPALGPPVVALAALATALAPGGFKAGPIVAAVVLVSVGLAATALWQRSRAPPEPGVDAWWGTLRASLQRRA